MNTEDMIRELRNVEEKYKNKTYATGETNISLMCSEVADRLEALYKYKCGKPTPLGVGWIAQKYKK